MMSRYMDGNSKEITLYKNLHITKKPIVLESTTHVNEEGDESAKKIEISLTMQVKLGDQIFERAYNKGHDIRMFIPKRAHARKIIKIGEITKGHIPKYDLQNITFEIPVEEFEVPLIMKIREIEKGFYLSEEELITEADNIIKGKYKYVYFRTQKEISGCVADGLAFCCSEDHGYQTAKIIGFEAKTNKDNYERLYRQTNAYLSICDEVYLIVQDKKVPADLPFFVGVISAMGGKGEIIRYAQNLKHEMNGDEFWNSLMGNAIGQCNIKKKGKINSFEYFRAIETLKRKMIWRQFVDGWPDGATVKLTNQEKSMIRTFYDTKQENL